MGIGVPIGLISLLAMMILPLPPVMLDVLFTFNIALSLVIVMAVFQGPKAARVRDLPDRAVARDDPSPGAERRPRLASCSCTATKAVMRPAR
jgi:hypothetical protein